MKTVLAALAGISMLAVCGTASAEYYGSLGYSNISVDTTPSVDLGAVTGRVGWNSPTTPWLGVEGEVSVGVKDETFAGPPPVTLELKHLVAGYVVARVPVGETFEVFARAGYGTIKIEASSGGLGAAASDDGFIYGAGGQFNFGVNGVRAEYVKYGDDTDGYTVSFVRKF